MLFGCLCLIFPLAVAFSLALHETGVWRLTRRIFSACLLEVSPPEFHKREVRECSPLARRKSVPGAMAVYQNTLKFTGIT